MSLLNFDDLARARGDGLHPALRQLLERRQALQTDIRIADLAGVRGGMVQAGPNPVPAPGVFRPGNVIDFKFPAAETEFDGRTAAKGQA